MVRPPRDADLQCSDPLTQNTNVLELCARIKRNNKQLIYYNSGIGTLATPNPGFRARIRQMRDLAFAMCVFLLPPCAL